MDESRTGHGTVQPPMAGRAVAHRSVATNYWKKQFPDAPLITAYWGWEKIANWVTPDYFPLFPSDDQFTKLVARDAPWALTPFRGHPATTGP